MFRCDNCGSGYSVRAKSEALDSCPRCLAREGLNSPLIFELGLRGTAEGAAGGDQVQLGDDVTLQRRPLREGSEVEAA